MREIESARDPALGHKKVGLWRLKGSHFPLRQFKGRNVILAKLETHFRQVSDPHAMQGNIREKYPSNPKLVSKKGKDKIKVEVDGKKMVVDQKLVRDATSPGDGEDVVATDKSDGSNAPKPDAASSA